MPVSPVYALKTNDVAAQLSKGGSTLSPLFRGQLRLYNMSAWRIVCRSSLALVLQFASNFPMADAQDWTSMSSSVMSSGDVRPLFVLELLLALKNLHSPVYVQKFMIRGYLKF